MSDEKVVSILEQYRAKEAHQSVPMIYQAAKVERERVPRIRVHYSNGYVDAISYAYIKNMLSVTPDRIGLLTFNGVVFIKGRNIRLLLDDLQEERVSSLQPFDPVIHKATKDDAPIINRIEWKTNGELINM